MYLGVLVTVAMDAERRLSRSAAIRQERDSVLLTLEERSRDVEAAMAEAEASDMARAQVLASASHDLRQPLHALSVYSAILAENPNPQTLRDVSKNMEQIVRSLGNLVNGLLDLSQLNVGRYVPERREFALEVLIEDVCNEYRSALAAKGLRLHLGLTPLHIHDDPVAIGRIARNLIDNAIKYTEQGWVRVSTKQEDGRALLTVADSGRGIAAEAQSRVFEEFYQEENPGRDHSLGVGLGLTIVRRLAALLAARITLTSSPGRGSIFTVHFAGRVSEPIPAALPELALDRSVIASQQVFLVDDDPDVLRSMGVLLAAWGAKTHLARSPQETERLFRRLGRPALLIADIRLGGPEHGVALAERLQVCHGPFPVIVLTGETASGALLEAREKHYPVLLKPVQPERLRQAIGDVLSGTPPVAGTAAPRTMATDHDG